MDTKERISMLRASFIGIFYEAMQELSYKDNLTLAEETRHRVLLSAITEANRARTVEDGPTPFTVVKERYWTNEREYDQFLVDLPSGEQEFIVKSILCTLRSN